MHTISWQVSESQIGVILVNGQRHDSHGVAGACVGSEGVSLWLSVPIRGRMKSLKNRLWSEKIKSLPGVALEGQRMRTSVYWELSKFPGPHLLSYWQGTLPRDLPRMSVYKFCWPWIGGVAVLVIIPEWGLWLIGLPGFNGRVMSTPFGISKWE